jgi:GNAT superfamily N-acetyltransferase
MMTIRSATAADLPVLRDIERAAGEAFRPIGMPEIADDEPLPVDALAAYVTAGRAWVAAEPDAEPVAEPAAEPAAYLIAEVIDGNLHIEQVSVHPRAARRGIGRALIERAAAYAREHGLPALTLTTFLDVPWNAPYYERCGFHPLAEADLSPGLRAVVRHEANLGLTRWPRVAMRRPA